MEERLQKIIARAGIASRRHAELLIQSGQVRVNGVVVRELGSKADVAVDKIEAAGKLVGAGERKVYLLLHKPPEVVSSLADPEGRKNLRNFLRGFPERVYPVGNLEYAASGLVFLTNDGDLAAEMLRGWAKLEQVYHLKVKGMLRVEELDRLGKEVGVRLETVRQPDASRGHAANFWYEVRMQDSKLDDLRWLLAKELHPIEKVKRIGLGPLTLEGIPRGRYRLLAKKDLDGMMAGKVAKIARAKVVPETKAFMPQKDVEEQKAFVERKFEAQKRDYMARKYAEQGKRPPFVPRKHGEDRREFAAKKFAGKKSGGGRNFADSRKPFGGQKSRNEQKGFAGKPRGEQERDFGEYESRRDPRKDFRPGQSSEGQRPAAPKRPSEGRREAGGAKPGARRNSFGGPGKFAGGKKFGGRKFTGGRKPFGGAKKPSGADRRPD